MITLSLLDSQQKHSLQEWNFEQESPIRVGRSADNHVVLNDALVSRHHLELHHLGYSHQRELWQLQSRGTNGTFLDGKLVSQSLLSENCLIQLGPGGPVLKLQTEPVSPATSDPLNGCAHKGNHPDNLFCIHCGQPIQVQWTIGNYHVLRLLAEETEATYLVWQPQPLAGQPPLQLLQEIDPQPTAAGFEQLARMQSLHHPRIPQIFDCFQEAAKHYLVTELIHGQDLDTWVRQHGPVSPQQAIAWMLQACEVLDYVHNQDPPIVHGDIRPSNLIVRHCDQEIAVVNFGFEQQVDTLPATQIALMGYRAPEQAEGQACPQSDLYAIGATLLFLLTGENPHKFYQRGSAQFNLQRLAIPLPLKTVIQRSTAAIKDSEVCSARDNCWQGHSGRLRSVFQRGSRPERDENHSETGGFRYPTATELARALKACI